MKKEHQREKTQGKKNFFKKVGKFHLQISKGAFYICTACHCCLYQYSVRIFYDQKYILTSAKHDPMTSFNYKIYDHKYLSNNVIPCQVVCNKMEIDPISNCLRK